MILLCKVYFFPQKTIKPGLAAFYDIRPGNGVGLFSKEKISKEKMKKKRMWGSTRDKQANNIYSTKIKNRIKGALCPGASTGSSHWMLPASDISMM